MANRAAVSDERHFRAGLRAGRHGIAVRGELRGGVYLQGILSPLLAVACCACAEKVRPAAAAAAAAAAGRRAPGILLSIGRALLGCHLAAPGIAARAACGT